MAGDDGSVVRRLYLSVYNWASFFGWLQVLYHAILALLGGGPDHEAVYDAVKLPLLFSQTAALIEILPRLDARNRFVSHMNRQKRLQTIYCCPDPEQIRSELPSAKLESRKGQTHIETFGFLFLTYVLAVILHSITGFVRSPISATLPQVGIRTSVLWFIVWSFPETQSSVFITSLVLSWSISEVIRYPFFGLREAFGITPFWLLWLRYSMFIVLYPIGLISEVGLIFTAMPHMKGGTFYICAALTTIYVPGFPRMYGYMFAQRKKNLSKVKAA